MRRALHTREQLLHLLAEAAELEHNLLCTYLYAAFSLKRGIGEGLSSAELSAVDRWRHGVMAVAVEEMSHLALVANLTVAIGARPHFNRPNLPVAPGYHPAGIVVELARFDTETLDHFIFLERPQSAAVTDGDRFESEIEYERGERPGAALMPAAEDYSTIAEFYDVIRDAFSSVARAIGERRLFCGDPAQQVGSDVVRMPGLESIVDLRSALRAMDTIVSQGEGAASENEDCHFARFVSMRKEYDALLAANPRFEPSRPVARNPVMRVPVDSGSRVHANHPRAAAALDLANAVYNQMLRLLVQAYGRSASTLEAKRTLLESAMKTMGVLRAIGEHVTSLPARDDTPGVRAGVTFTMFRATEPLCESPGEWAAIGERFRELAQGARGADLPDMEKAVETAAEKLEALAQTFSAA